MVYKFPLPEFSNHILLVHSLGTKLNQYLYEKPYDYFFQSGVYNILDLRIDFSQKPFWQLSGGTETDATFMILDFPDLDKEYPRVSIVWK